MRSPTPWVPDFSRKSTSEPCSERPRASAEASFTVTYKGHSVGEYFADLLVEDVLVVELKCVERLPSEHTAQCLNYLRASGRIVCLLVNFQKPKLEWKRIVQGFPISERLEKPIMAR